MKFTVDDFMEHAFTITVDDAGYERLCRRFRAAGFPTVPRQYNGRLPKCLIGIGVHHIACINQFFLVNMAKTMGWDHVTIFEYDAYPMINCYHELGNLLNNGGVPDDAEVISFGNLHWIRDWTNGGVGHHCLKNVDDQKRFGVIKDDLFGAHAVTYFARGFDHWMNNYRGMDRECNCDFYRWLTHQCYAPTRSFFIQAKEIMQYRDWYVDQANLKDFPEVTP